MKGMKRKMKILTMNKDNYNYNKIKKKILCFESELNDMRIELEHEYDEIKNEYRLLMMNKRPRDRDIDNNITKYNIMEKKLEKRKDKIMIKEVMIDNLKDDLRKKDL